MADILIRGMEMPQSCWDCPIQVNPFCVLDLIELTDTEKRIRPENCPLVEIPPHGRLIDADLFSKVLKGRAAEELNQHTAPFSWSYAYECLIDTVGLIPTVIPADKDGEI